MGGGGGGVETKRNESKENGRIEGGVFGVANGRTWMNDKEL